MYKLMLLILLFTFQINLNKTSNSNKKIIMAIFAHADDEQDVSPLLAKYADLGYDVYLVIATNGDKGTNDHSNIPAGIPLANVRKQEAVCACTKLGIKDPIFLDLPDGSLTENNSMISLHSKIDSLISSYSPDVVITWGSDGGYGHTDHRMVHNIVTDIFQTGIKKIDSKLYYTGIPTEHWLNLPPYKSTFGEYAHQSWIPIEKKYLTTRISYGIEEFTKASRAYSCYKSQFTLEQIEDSQVWMEFMNRDTVYLRPFSEIISTVVYEF